MALAGIWRADLELDDGDDMISMHLAVPKFQVGTEVPDEAFGKVYLMNDTPLRPWSNICDSGSSAAWWSAYRLVRAGADGDQEMQLQLQLGNLYLEGRGKRDGFRCSSFEGTVLEGGEDPYVVGRFSMHLSLPIVSEIDALQKRYQQRIASRPAPPIIYSRSSYVDTWRLLLSLDDDSPPAYFPVQLAQDGSWQSVGTEETLGGKWGVSSREGHGMSTVTPAGSHMWLQVDSKRCTETLRGLAGLPVRSDFELEGKPVIETEEQELAARASGGAEARADRVDGHLCVGSVERAYFGSFRLLRGDAAARAEAAEAAEATEAAEAAAMVSEVASTMVLAASAETVAKAAAAEAEACVEHCQEALRAADASLIVALQEAKLATQTALHEAELATQRLAAAQGASVPEPPTLSEEEAAAAERAWLASVPELSTLSEEEEEAAKRAWLASRAPPSWGTRTMTRTMPAATRGSRAAVGANKPEEAREWLKLEASSF